MFSEYFFKSKSLFYSLLVTLPLFIIYEIGIFFLFQADIAFSKNGADVLIEEFIKMLGLNGYYACLLYTSPSPRDATLSRMPSSA